MSTHQMSQFRPIGEVRDFEGSRKQLLGSTTRKHASYACVRCRGKKSKCRFENPGDSSCLTCTRAKIQCEIEPGTDMRSSRHRQQVRQDQQLLHKLVDALRGTEQAHSILKSLQDCMSAAELETCLDKLKEPISERMMTHIEQRSSRLSDGWASPPCLCSESNSDKSSTSTTPADHAHDPSVQDQFEVPELNSRTKGCYIAPGAVRSFGNLAMTNAIMTNSYPPSIQRRQIRVITSPLATCTPLNIALDEEGTAGLVAKAMLGFRDAARSIIAEGVPVQTVLSMDGVDLELLFRDRTAADQHTLSTWACEFAKSWLFIPQLIRLAISHFASSFMRWLILPCQETYLRVSPLLRPTLCQLMVPHTMDVDLCHFPVVRDYQVLYGRRWVDKLAADSQRLHWPYCETDCLQESIVGGLSTTDHANTDGLIKIRRLSPTFVEFIDDVQNWSIHRAMLRETPELASYLRLHGDDMDADGVA